MGLLRGLSLTAQSSPVLSHLFSSRSIPHPIPSPPLSLSLSLVPGRRSRTKLQGSAAPAARTIRSSRVHQIGAPHGAHDPLRLRAERRVKCGTGVRRRRPPRAKPPPACFSPPNDSELASSMLLASSISSPKTYYEVLSVNEGATYDEIRAGYRSAILNAHPDKSQANPDLLVSSGEGEFLSAQKAWEVLRDPKSRAEYDKQLQTSRQNLENVAYEIEVEEMTIEGTDHEMELLYPCRCGDYFSISSFDLGEMGILIREDGNIDFQSSDCASASVVLGCGSCSLKSRLVINRSS